MSFQRVAVVGLGKLGSSIAVSFAAKGYRSVGIDINSAYVAALAAHKAPVKEPGLQELIDQNKERISATDDWDDAIGESDASFIVVPTPSVPEGGFSNEFVVSACEKIGASLKNKKLGFHVVVVVSTMMPGSSEGEIIPALEAASGKKVGVDFGYCYSPTLIALGSVIHDFLHPDLLMIGTPDKRSGDELEAFYRTVVDSKTIIHRATTGEVELAKISINTFITTKISFANMLAMIADTMKDVNVDNVTKILGSDSRIGGKYLKAGGSYGGPCFPRDNRALTRAADLAGVQTHIPKATDATNALRIEHIAAQAERALVGGAGGKVGIVGVAYKLDTNVVEEALGMHLARIFIEKKIPVVIYDPVASHTASQHLGDKVSYADSLEDCMSQAEVLVIANPYRSMFADLKPELIKSKKIIDCWKILPTLVR